MTVAAKTTMTNAFEKAGVSRADMIFYSAAIAYLRDGGTVDGAAAVIARAAEKSSSEGPGLLNIVTHHDHARPVREPSPQERAASARIAVVAAHTALDRYRTSDGRAWGVVGVHELDGMSRDGAIASAVKSHLGALSNTQRFMTLRDLKVAGCPFARAAQ